MCQYSIPKRTGETRSLVPNPPCIRRRRRYSGGSPPRILGELAKLGVKVARSTVGNILREAGIEPGPKRGEGTWSEFVHRHAATLLACDFFSVKVWTWRGPVEYFVLFFLHVGSCRVQVAGITASRARVTQVLSRLKVR